MKRKTKTPTAAGPLPTPLTADQILNTRWPDPKWAVPGILPVGLAVLGGRPKAFKSWLDLQIVQAKAAGGDLFGQKVTQGPCLYLALEDTPRRLQYRMEKQGWPPKLPVKFFV